MLWVGQPDEWNFFAFPVALKSYGLVGANRNDDRVTRGEGLDLVAQVREMSPAVGSHETSQEDQDDIFLRQEV